MGKGDYLGEFELVVLATLVRLGDDAYGMQVRRDIEQSTGREVSIGAVYATLRRLASKGYIISRLGQASPERGGRAKRFFHLQPAGARALERTRDLFVRVLRDLPETLA